MTDNVQQPISDGERAWLLAYLSQSKWLATRIRGAVLALDARLSAAERERDKLAAFKAYVHERLDQAGVPVDPPSEHQAKGCRIGGRLDWLLRERDGAKELLRQSSDGAIVYASKYMNQRDRAYVDLDAAKVAAEILRDALTEVTGVVDAFHRHAPHLKLAYALAVARAAGVAVAALAAAPRAEGGSEVAARAGVMESWKGIDVDGASPPVPAVARDENVCGVCGAAWGTRHSETCFNVPSAQGGRS